MNTKQHKKCKQNKIKSIGKKTNLGKINTKQNKNETNCKQNKIISTFKNKPKYNEHKTQRRRQRRTETDTDTETDRDRHGHRRTETDMETETDTETGLFFQAVEDMCKSECSGVRRVIFSGFFLFTFFCIIFGA